MRIYQLILTLFTLSFYSCELLNNSESKNDPAKNVSEIEKYSPNEWISMNRIKMEYLEDQNFRLVFKVGIDSVNKRYYLIPNIKIIRKEIIKRAKEYSNSYNLDIEKSILGFSIRHINSSFNKNASFTVSTSINSLLNSTSDTLYLLDLPNIKFQKKDGIDKIDITYPPYDVTQNDFFEAVKADHYLNSKSLHSYTFYVTYLPCGDKEFSLIPSGCRICGKNFVQFINFDGIGSVLKLNDICY